MPNLPDSDSVRQVVQQSAGFIVKSWRGDETLGTAFWRNIWGAGLCWRVAVIIAESSYNPSEPHGMAIELVVIALYVLGIPLFIWALVSLWRSATKHQLRGDLPATAFAAKAFVVMMILAALGQIREATSK